MLLYDRVVPLNKDKHRLLRLKGAEGAADFASGTHYVPIAASEFFQACRDYPLIFAGGEEGGPIALLGLRENENLFISSAGEWQPNTYIPAFVRRYPFVLAQGDDTENFTVCFDESYSALNHEDGDRLFTDEGAHAPFLERVIHFLQSYRGEMLQTNKLVERLNALDLLIEKDLRVSTSSGESFSLQGFRIVDEDRLRKLADGKVGELIREGYMGWIYAHLISLNNLSRLPDLVSGEPVPAGERPDGQQAQTETEPDSD